MHVLSEPPNQDIQYENIGRIILENPRQKWVPPVSDAENLEWNVMKAISPLGGMPSVTLNEAKLLAFLFILLTKLIKS